MYIKIKYLKYSIKYAKVIESEIEQSVRNQGYASLEQVGAVYP